MYTFLLFYALSSLNVSVMSSDVLLVHRVCIDVNFSAVAKFISMNICLDIMDFRTHPNNFGALVLLYKNPLLVICAMQSIYTYHIFCNIYNHKLLCSFGAFM